MTELPEPDDKPSEAASDTPKRRNNTAAVQRTLKDAADVALLRVHALLGTIDATVEEIGRITLKKRKPPDEQRLAYAVAQTANEIEWTINQTLTKLEHARFRLSAIRKACLSPGQAEAALRAAKSAPERAH